MNWWSEAERPQAIREALQQIEAEIPRLRRYARYLGYEPDHADDLVQEGLVRALAEIPTAVAKVHTEPPGTSLRGWLFAILRSCHTEETRAASVWMRRPAPTRHPHRQPAATKERARPCPRCAMPISA
jgi:DNA-directed RNA polymerase specialized sigma24 family protein